MRIEILDALQKAYIDSQESDMFEGKVITDEQINVIVKEMVGDCGVNVTYSSDPNYSTSYQLQVMEKDIPTPFEIARQKIDRQQLPNHYSGLFVYISWLAPFAMKYWNKFEKGKDPIYNPDPKDERERATERCVIEILNRHGIQMLSEEELEEDISDVSIILLDNAPTNVRHLLFAQYL
jgi:hypothetical protein